MGNCIYFNFIIYVTVLNTERSKEYIGYYNDRLSFCTYIYTFPVEGIE